MSRKPDLERSLVAVWDLLSDMEKQQMRLIGGFAPDWGPGSQPLTRKQRLEGLEELKRIMPMEPGRISQWRQELIDSVEPEGSD